MSGRRNHPRVTFRNSRGVLHVSRDVVIEKAVDDEFVAVSSEPGVPGDVLTIAFSAENSRKTQTVRVTASRPVMVQGVVKHELRLRVEELEADDLLAE